jgi:hypothetical protein
MINNHINSRNKIQQKYYKCYIKTDDSSYKIQNELKNN